MTLPRYLSGPLPVILVALAAVFALAFWGNVRRNQNRHHHPKPLPPVKATVATAAATLFTGRGLLLSAALLAFTAAATLYAGGLGLAAGLIGFTYGGYRCGRRILTVRDAWTDTMFQVTAEHLAFPDGASAARWIFPQGWDHLHPKLVLIRCPDDFDPKNRTVARLVSLAWNNDPILSAKTLWSFEIGEQRKQPDKHQVVAYPKPRTEPADDALDPIVALTNPAKTGTAPDEPSKWPLRLAKLLRLIRAILPILTAAYLIWQFIRDPGAAWRWGRTHPAIPVFTVITILLCLMWTWARLTFFAKRDKPKKGALLLLRNFYGLTIWEDRWLLRIPILALGIAAFYIAATNARPATGFLALGVWLVLAITRHAIVAKGRRTVLTDMFDIARTHLEYERHWKLRRGQRPVGHWRRIAVSWGSAAVPGLTEVQFPTGFKTSSWKIMSGFYEEWTQKAFPANDKGHSGLEWEFEIDLAKKAVRCTPFVPVNPTDVRLADALPETTTQFLAGRITRTGSWCITDLKTSPHILVCGETGGGKSATMETMVYQKARTPGWEVQIADGGGSGGWARWEGRPGIIPAVPDGPEACTIALTYPQIGAMFAEIRREMDRRKELLVHYKVSSIAALPKEVRPNYRFLACDEWLSLLSTMSKKAISEEDKGKKAIAEQVWSDWSYVILEGRKVGMHSVTGAQRPDAAMFGGALRDNIGIRICCGWMTEPGLRMMFGETYRAPADFVGIEGQGTQSGRELPQGRQLVRPGSGKGVMVVQGPWFGGADNDEDLNTYLPVQRTAADGQPLPIEAAPSAVMARPTDVLVGLATEDCIKPKRSNSTRRLEPAAEPQSALTASSAAPPANTSSTVTANWGDDEKFPPRENAPTNPFLKPTVLTAASPAAPTGTAPAHELDPDEPPVPLPAPPPTAAAASKKATSPRRKATRPAAAPPTATDDDQPPAPASARTPVPPPSAFAAPSQRLPRFEDDE